MVTSLNGEPEEGIVVEAVGQDKCSHFLEESSSEASGQFRIRGLQPEVGVLLHLLLLLASSCPSVCLSSWNSLAPTGRILMKLDI
jgi:hypothetical protein